MPINTVDELHAATEKGKIASAKEVFLTGDTENLQQIGEKTHQLEDSIKNIAATGGASTAAAVTFDNAASGMTAVTAQGAIEELNTKNNAQDTEIAKKANSTDVNSKMNEESNRVDAEIAKKVDKTSIVQEFGNSKTQVPSQDVVSRNFNNLLNLTFNKKNIDQNIGSSTEKVVSQKAITERLLFSDENFATAHLSELVSIGIVGTTYYELANKHLISGKSYVVEITLIEDAENAILGLTNETTENNLILLYKGNLSAGVHRFLFPYKGESYLRTYADDGYTKFSDIKFYGITSSSVKSLMLEHNVPLKQGGIYNSTGFVTDAITIVDNFSCAFIEVHKGDIIKIKGYGGQNFRLYAILDKDYNVIEGKVAASELIYGYEREITIEEGDKYAVLNVNNTKDYSITLYRNVVYKSNNDSLLDLYYYFKDIPFLEDRGYINYETTLGNIVSQEGRVCQRILVKEGEIYRIKASGGVNYRAFSSVKENGEINRRTIAYQGIDMTIKVMAEEKYFVINSPKENEHYIKKLCIKEENKDVTIALATAADNIKAKANYLINSAEDLKEIVSSPQTKNITLLEGEYVLGNSPIIVNKAIKIKGEGNVTLRRDNGYIIKVNDEIEGFELENLTLNSPASLYNESYGKAYKLKNITYNNKYIKNFAYTNDSRLIVSIGNGENSTIDDLSQLLDFVMPFSEKKEIFIYVYGQNKTNKKITINRHVNIIGKTKDASIEVEVNESGDGVSFIYTNTYGEMNSYVEGVRFIRSGEFNGYQLGAVLVTTNSITFRDCIFENRTSSPEAFNQATDTHGLGVNPYGDRRHGILIECSKYEDCEVIFHNCKAIGSPYGFKNTRGWYIKKGSPRLYDCIGIGGGIGERGYGIVLHMASKAFVYNSQFYGSPYGYRLNNGMQFQAATESRMYHCTGFAGNGFQYISNGSKNFVKQNTRCGASYGVGCIIDVSPLLIDCVGYSGWAEGSCSLYIADTCHPIIQGGVYSIDTIIYHDVFKKDSGSLYMTLPLDNVEQSIKITGIYVRDSKITGKNKAVIKSGDTIIANEVIRVTELSLKLLTDKIDPNKSIEFHITDLEGNDVSVDDRFTNIIVRYTSGNSWSPKFEGDNTHSKINNAFFDTV